MKRTLKCFVILGFLGAAALAMAQSPEPPLSDTRLTVHTLLREDIFSGFLTDNKERFARGEKNIALLMQQRPQQKPNLLAWSGGAHLYRAIEALDAGREDDFKQQYQLAKDLFAQARTATGGNEAVAPVTGGSYLLFADRLPKEYRAEAYSQAYDAYHVLLKQQANYIDKLPLHMKGELLAGLAQSAARTGHTEEMGEYLDKIITLLPGTPYETVAKKWKANPAAAQTDTIACMTCHDPGRLQARLTALGPNPQ